MTLTVSQLEKESPREAFLRTSKKVSKLFAHLRKKDPEIRFARVLESTKKGFPHYHFCMKASYVPQAELSKMWCKLTGASIVDIRALKGRAISYIAKYVTKSDTVSYTRQRVSFSRNWPKEEKKQFNVDFGDWRTIHNDELPEYIATTKESGQAEDMTPSIIKITENGSTSEVLAELENQFGIRKKKEISFKEKNNFVLPKKEN